MWWIEVDSTDLMNTAIGLLQVAVDAVSCLLFFFFSSSHRAYDVDHRRVAVYALFSFFSFLFFSLC